MGVYESWVVSDLRAELAERGLIIKGLKDVLVKRLIAHDKKMERIAKKAANELIKRWDVLSKDIKESGKGLEKAFEGLL